MNMYWTEEIFRMNHKGIPHYCHWLSYHYWRCFTFLKRVIGAKEIFLLKKCTLQISLCWKFLCIFNVRIGCNEPTFQLVRLPKITLIFCSPVWVFILKTRSFWGGLKYPFMITFFIFSMVIITDSFYPAYFNNTTSRQPFSLYLNPNINFTSSNSKTIFPKKSESSVLGAYSFFWENDVGSEKLFYYVLWKFGIDQQFFKIPTSKNL